MDHKYKQSIMIAMHAFQNCNTPLFKIHNALYLHCIHICKYKVRIYPHSIVHKYKQSIMITIYIFQINSESICNYVRHKQICNMQSMFACKSIKKIFIYKSTQNKDLCGFFLHGLMGPYDTCRICMEYFFRKISILIYLCSL